MSRTHVVVLGCGRVGSAIVVDLAATPGWLVKAVDGSDEALDRVRGLEGVTAVRADLSSPEEVRRVVTGAHLAIGAVPGFMGYRTVETVIREGVPTVDISFFPENPFDLDGAAKERGVPVLVDCGVAPGCGNMILGHVASHLDTVDEFICLVGGLPVERRWPFEYRAVFSPVDVIEEYTRPARLVENGSMVVRPALSEVELVDLPGIGTLEAFNSDGLRTLLTTMDIPSMKEKTLRYPGHAEKMRMLRESGFFSQREIVAGGVKVRPLDVSARLLTEAWRLGEGEEDLTVMRVVVVGQSGGSPVRVTYDLLDRYDRDSGTTSMARTTGYTCTAVARVVAAGAFSEPGVWAPEQLGRVESAYDLIIADLERHGVRFQVREASLDGA